MLIPKSKPESRLKVRLTVNNHFVEYYLKDRWTTGSRPAISLAQVRDIAQRLGYNDIQIEPR